MLKKVISIVVSFFVWSRRNEVMKKSIILLACCSVFTVSNATVANSAERNNSEDISKFTFNDYLNMTDEEISEYFKLSEYYFGDETVDDAVKFEKYLNTPPSNYGGSGWSSVKYASYEKFISGEAEPYLCFSPQKYIETVDFSPEDLGYPANWELEGYNGKRIVELGDGSIISKDINEYRLYVPIEVIADFETYVRLDLSSNYFSEIYGNNLYGIKICENINSQFKSRGAGYEVAQNRGDANCDDKVSMADAASIFQAIGNPDKYALSELGQFNADYACDGLTAEDAIAIQKKLIGIV